ncbi:MAG TPA: hypothetical protein DCX67_01515 [Opitutae bacterium]|nr:hypothetical protein [Opitutae bacterium]
MKINKKHRKNSNNRHLLGVGLDNDDGHKRVTSSEDFSIIGGSEETHEKMTETLFKTFEYLSRKDKTIDEISREELSDLLSKQSPN